MAEGSRGRRWRSNGLDAGRLVEVLLLEVDLRGRLARLEVSTVAGLLTLHPEHDESMIHGNVVRDDGVEPLAFAWSPEHELLVAGNVLPMLVATRRLAASAGGGDRTDDADRPALIVEAGLRVREVGLEVRRTAELAWTVRVLERVGAGGAQAIPGGARAEPEPEIAAGAPGTGEGTLVVSMSADGLPLGERALEWALEPDL